MIRKLRYYLTRMFFLSMGLRVGHYRRQVSVLWNLEAKDRNQILQDMLEKSRHLNSDGALITSLAEIETSPLLTKARYRELNQGSPKQGLFRRKTSGTTGEPTEVNLTRNELSRMLGVRDYCMRLYGVRLGDREARFWGQSENGLKTNLKNFLLNRRVCFPVGKNATQSITKIFSWEPEYLYGYASLLLEAAILVEENSLRFTPPKCVICTAETILPAQKEYLAKVFEAPVAEEYGATEFDIVAFECKEGHRHFVNPWLVVRESDKSLLITDVSRKSTSIVNYEIGDSGAIAKPDCNQFGDARCLAVLEGRSINRFAYLDPDTRFHSVDLAYAINGFQRNTGELFNFQIVQHEYGALELFISKKISHGTVPLKHYMENDIRVKTGRNIVVNVHVGERPTGLSSKSYFIQRIC